MNHDDDRCTDCDNIQNVTISLVEYLTWLDRSNSQKPLESNRKQEM